jgi:hypothetical protein
MHQTALDRAGSTRVHRRGAALAVGRRRAHGGPHPDRVENLLCADAPSPSSCRSLDLRGARPLAGRRRQVPSARRRDRRAPRPRRSTSGGERPPPRAAPPHRAAQPPTLQAVGAPSDPVAPGATPPVARCDRPRVRRVRSDAAQLEEGRRAIGRAPRPRTQPDQPPPHAREASGLSRRGAWALSPPTRATGCAAVHADRGRRSGSGRRRRPEDVAAPAPSSAACPR